MSSRKSLLAVRCAVGGVLSRTDRPPMPRGDNEAGLLKGTSQERAATTAKYHEKVVNTRSYGLNSHFN